MDNTYNLQLAHDMRVSGTVRHRSGDFIRVRTVTMMGTAIGTDQFGQEARIPFSYFADEAQSVLRHIPVR